MPNKHTEEKKIILDLCGGTGAWSKYYRDDPEYKVYVMTLPDIDVTDWRTIPSDIAYAIQENNVYGILAAPPCTQFSIARNDKTAKKPRDLEEGMRVIKACLYIIELCQLKKFRRNEGLQFWALENPASGYLDRFLGKPTYVFDPSDFGEPYSKKTALWGYFNEPKKGKKAVVKKGDEFNFVKSVEKFFDYKKDQIPPDYQKKTGYTKRTIVRSITPKGFAKAFYEANK